jgi:hypothetical protein
MGITKIEGAPGGALQGYKVIFFAYLTSVLREKNMAHYYTLNLIKTSKGT